MQECKKITVITFRSEQNLLLQVEQLEKDIKDLKLEIDELENDTCKKDNAYTSLQEIGWCFEFYVDPLIFCTIDDFPRKPLSLFICSLI